MAQRTKVVKANLSPVWNEIISLSNVGTNDQVMINICDVDKSLLGKESFTSIGEVRFPMHVIMDFVRANTAKEKVVPLTGKNAAGQVRK
jgi:Ca2+-dependent lipid-binding protein